MNRLPFFLKMFRCLQGFDMTKRTPISFEFFPPKTDAGAEKLRIVHQELQQLNQSFSRLLMVLVVLLVNAHLLLLKISMVKALLLPLTFLVLVMIRRVLLNYSIYTKLKALTVLSLYVATYHLDRLVLANFLMLKI